MGDILLDNTHVDIDFCDYSKELELPDELYMLQCCYHK